MNFALADAARSLSEAQLSALWAGQRFPAGALTTRQGVAVKVIFQGRAGRGAGPDFRGAVLSGPSGLALRGDVELHVKASSFREHGHARDPAYAGVILHVVFEDDTGEDTPLPGGGRAPVVALAPWVARRAGELERWLAQPPLWQEPCQDALDRLGPEAALAAVEVLGDARFAAKVERWRREARVHGREQALYSGLLEGLGYVTNAEPMRSLAALLSWADLRAGQEEPTAARRARYEALLLGCGGLLPSQREAPGTTHPHIEQLEAAFAREPARGALSATAWKLAVRPENAPARRLAGAAALLARGGGPAALLAAAWSSRPRDLIAAITVSADGYWENHYDPCAGACRLPQALVGRSRALEIAINVALPAACALGDAPLAANARALFTALPRPTSYGATRFLERTLRAGGRPGRINARRAQGLLALHRDWCTKNGCGRCPLS